MPRYPDISEAVRATKGSVYSMLGQRLRDFEGEVFPLHIGDTYMEPARGCWMEDIKVADHPGMHRYAPVQGLPSLVDAVVQKVQCATHENVLITAGATGALGAAVGAIVDPGSEVLILAPYWPLIAGIVQSLRGVAVPVSGVNDAREVGELLEGLSEALSTRTVALYINTPNNPTGRVLPPAWVEALVEWACREGLWILSDEVYEHYVYEGEHLACRPLAPERTFAAHSFSKTYGMAGNRCGYLLAPSSAMPAVRKVATHAFYSTPTASQIAAQRVLGGVGDEWIADASRRYCETGARAARRLGLPRPQGGTFLFFDVAQHLDERGLEGLLMDCADRGLFVAPGSSFGPDCPTHLRLCFTSAPPDVVMRGVEVLAQLLGR